MIPLEPSRHFVRDPNRFLRGKKIDSGKLTEIAGVWLFRMFWSGRNSQKALLQSNLLR
jgi:hypothetical protein